ncbi:MAG TPA: 3-deoxy-D-manno-octulosonic acid transferase [Phycisphaerae bacterium]|nr:3-deoxy-D-manno-octulosonic acid transferase [Phycisphaerae bacterium]
MPVRWLDLLYLPLAVAYLPFLLYQMIVLKKNRFGWGERFGAVATRPGDRPCVWIHAVSLGEVNATRSLVDEIATRMPGHDIVISATTDTGYAAAKRQYPDRLVFRYPLDLTPVVRRVFRRIRPSAILLMELEVWPNFLAIARQRGIAVCIANGRVTEEKSMRRFRRPVLRSLARRMFSQLSFVASQDETYAARFVELGVPPERVHVTGSLKYDTAVIADDIPGADSLAAAMGIDRAQPLIVAGSTGPGEEEILLDTFRSLRAMRPDVQLAIIPRKPERFDEVARLVESNGFPCIRRSQRPDAGVASNPQSPAVFLGDTMGELRKFYSLASVVFVGRTLVPLGGSDLMEVAALERPMCFGPHVENFADVAEKLLAAGGAVRIPSAAELPSALHELLADRPRAVEVGRQARAIVQQNLGATGRTVDLLLGLGR